MAVEKVGQDESKKRKRTCTNCGAVLTFYPKDVTRGTYTCQGDSDFWYYVVCPQCDSKVEVPDR